MAKGSGYVNRLLARAYLRGYGTESGGGRTTIRYPNRRVTYDTRTGRVIETRRKRRVQGAVPEIFWYEYD